MEFDECWNKHLNQGDDTVTLEMINKYGIKAVRQIAELSWVMSKHYSSTQPPVGRDSKGRAIMEQEGYPKNWQHCMIHLNPKTGEMHSDGDHCVREWIQDKLKGRTDSPNLGLATNAELIEELRARMEVHGNLEYKPDGDSPDPSRRLFKRYNSPLAGGES